MTNKSHHVRNTVTKEKVVAVAKTDNTVEDHLPSMSGT
jgi:hypothetical protein